MRLQISVVVPTFRRPQQLRETLASVSGQGDASLEVIVVDDSPEGSAREVVNCLEDPRMRYLLNPAPSGGIPSRVRNLGLRHCTGALVHFLDDDDIVPEGYYQRAREAFRSSPRVGIVFGRIEPFGDGPAEQLARERGFFQNASRRARLCTRLGSVLPFTGQMLFGHVLFVCGAAILRRECAEAVGGFDPDIILHEDRDFFVRLIRAYGVRFIDSLSLHYRIGYPSLMHASDPSPEQLALERHGRKFMKKKYLAAHGPIEFYGLKIATKLLNSVT